MVLVTVKIKNKTGETWDAVTPCASCPSGRRALAQTDEERTASLPLTSRALASSFYV
jgi:hypothetical protein